MGALRRAAGRTPFRYGQRHSILLKGAATHLVFACAAGLHTGAHDSR